MLRFDAALAELSADAFIDEVLVQGLGVAHVVIGYDFRFGKGRTGDPEMLRSAGAARGFGVTVVAQVAGGGEVFSSSAIRAELAQGDVAGRGGDAGPLLARQRARSSAGPSAAPSSASRRPTSPWRPTRRWPTASTRCACTVDGNSHAAAAYLGTRPTFDDGAPLLEVFLFDFHGDLYGREMSVEFIDHIRADRRFDSAEALKAQMQRDCDRARAILERAPSQPVDRS